MRFSLLKHLTLAFVLTLLPHPTLAQSDEEKARAELKELQADIARINREISSANKRRDKLQNQLREAELEQSRISRDINRANEAIANQRNELRQLQKQKSELELQRDEQQTREYLQLIAQENARGVLDEVAAVSEFGPDYSALLDDLLGVRAFLPLASVEIHNMPVGCTFARIVVLESTCD